VAGLSGLLLELQGCKADFRLDIRRKFFPPEGGDTLNRLPKEAVDAPSLEAFKTRLDVALGSLVCWLATLHIAGGLELDDHCGPLQPKPFYDSMKSQLRLFDALPEVLNLQRTAFCFSTAAVSSWFFPHFQRHRQVCCRQNRTVSVRGEKSPTLCPSEVHCLCRESVSVLIETSGMRKDH